MPFNNAVYFYLQTFDILASEFGAWPSQETADLHVFHKLDSWEDNYRRRLRMVKNPLGTTHPEAVLEPVNEDGRKFRP